MKAGLLFRINQIFSEALLRVTPSRYSLKAYTEVYEIAFDITTPVGAGLNGAQWLPFLMPKLMRTKRTGSKRESKGSGTE
jgi:hypothetical protein